MRWFPSDGFAWRTLVFAAAFELGLGALAWGAGLVIGVDTLETARFSFKGLLIGALATAPLIAALACLIRWPVGPFEELLRTMRTFAQTFLAPCGIVGLALVSLCAGLGEEILIRGLVHTLALQHVPPVLALIATAAVFGLMHPISRTYVVVAAVIGVYLGAIWRISGPDLAAPFLCHAVYDFVALMVLCGTTTGSAVSERC